MQSVNFRDPDFLEDHIRRILAFYHPRCVDREHGGFFQHFRDDGSVYDHATRHLVSSTRFVFNYASAATHFQNSEYRDVAEHGLSFLLEAHWQPPQQGFAWVLNNREASDEVNYCYGLAFVVLAAASAMKASVPRAFEVLELAIDVLDSRFWIDADGLYADEASVGWTTLSEYRGQNANMHGCEALIASYEATGESRYLHRALAIARRVTKDLTQQCDGFVWEHYDARWKVDWAFNRDNPKDLFRPWGIQAGHQTEWAKLLVILDRYCDEEWLLPTAQDLFDRTLRRAWDAEHGGIVYGNAPDGSVCDDDKYFWVQAETFAAAAALAVATGNDEYWDWYDRIWKYSWSHFVDHEHGAWFRILTPDNRKYDDLKSPAGKTDYHTMGACYEAIRSQTESSSSPG
ncbi:MAG: AGE family epimerase/isomerase [Pseudomonadota bacterium]